MIWAILLTIVVAALAASTLELRRREKALRARVEWLEIEHKHDAEVIDAMFDQLKDYETDAGGIVREVRR